MAKLTEENLFNSILFIITDGAHQLLSDRYLSLILQSSPVGEQAYFSMISSFEGYN